MIPEKLVKEDDEMTEDVIENLLVKLKNNPDSLNALLKILDGLDRGGTMGIIEKIANGAIPSDALYLFEFFTSGPVRDSLIKSGNLVFLLMQALSDEKISDAIKAVAANTSIIAEAASSATDNTERVSALKLYSLLRDPDISFAIMSMMGVLKAAGKILREFKKESKEIESL